jgi:hypothetical protein
MEKVWRCGAGTSRTTLSSSFPLAKRRSQNPIQKPARQSLKGWPNTGRPQGTHLKQRDQPRPGEMGVILQVVYPRNCRYAIIPIPADAGFWGATTKYWTHQTRLSNPSEVRVSNEVTFDSVVTGGFPSLMHCLRNCGASGMSQVLPVTR